jgi:hypothetical protein
VTFASDSEVTWPSLPELVRGNPDAVVDEGQVRYPLDLGNRTLFHQAFFKATERLGRFRFLETILHSNEFGALPRLPRSIRRPKHAGCGGERQVRFRPTIAPAAPSLR